MTNVMERDTLNGLMEKSTEGNGLKGSNMGLEYIRTQRVKRRRESGFLERGKNGLAILPLEVIRSDDDCSVIFMVCFEIEEQKEFIL
jgi:hypothetical protein